MERYSGTWRIFVLGFLFTACSPACVDVAKLPPSPFLQDQKAIAEKIDAYLKRPARSQGDNLPLPNGYTIDVATHVADGRWIVAAHTGPRSSPGRLFEVSKPGGSRQLPHPSGIGSIDNVQVLSEKPIKLVLDTFTFGETARSKHAVYLYEEGVGGAKMLSNDSGSSVISPDKSKIALIRLDSEAAHVEVIDLQTYKSTRLFSLCTKGSQVSAPRVLWTSRTNLVCLSTNETFAVLVDLLSKNLYRL